MALGDLTERRAVLRAIAEFDSVGREVFLSRYGFGPAREYFVRERGSLYDSKAIAGVAHSYQHGVPLTSGEFSGGEDHVKPVLEAMGFEVVRTPGGPADSAGTSGWDLAPGDRIRRKDMHDRYGGSRQGGISPSRQSPNVILFSDPATGTQHGYHDRWEGDGSFHYVGEGQQGDQEMKNGNRALHEHVTAGRAVRVFNGSGGEVEYVGEFRVDPDDPFHVGRAEATGGGPMRSVLVFHLLPVGDVVRPEAASAGPTPMTVVEVEAHTTEQYLMDPGREPIEAERREQALVHRFKSHLEAQGHNVTRHLYKPPASRMIACDLFDETDRMLVEAKGHVRRESVRMAIGQLFDYRRFEPDPPASSAILLPREPSGDLLDLAHSAGLQVIWETESGFSTA